MELKALFGLFEGVYAHVLLIPCLVGGIGMSEVGDGGGKPLPEIG